MEARPGATERTTAARHRPENAIARHDTRDWGVKRCERSGYLIELGGGVVKARLVELADDDRSLVHGAFPELADRSKVRSKSSAPYCGGGGRPDLQ